MASFEWPPTVGGSSSGVPIYDTLADFPSGTNVGDLAVAADTQILYAWTGSAWEVIGGPGDLLSVGTIDSVSPSADGASESSNQLIMQSASATKPGLVNNTTQTFSGAKTFSSAINMDSNKIDAVADPTLAQDAATKNYVDIVASSLQTIQAVAYASAATNYPGTMVGNVLTITATGAISVDGSTPTLNSRILLKDQSTGSQNGVYVVTTVGTTGVSPVLTRAADYNTAADVNAGSLVPVISGTVNTTTSWLQTATIVTINTDSLVFVEWTANPANYLLKANNLSDVATPATAFNNISPVTAAGDLILGNGSNSSTNLAIGANNTALTSNGTTASWNLLTNSNLSGSAGVSNANLASMNTLTIKGNNTGGGSTPIDLTVAQVNSMLGGLSNPMTTLGDIIYEDASPAPARLAGQTTSTKNFLTQTGTGSASNVPAWGTIASGDVPTLNQNTTGTAANITGSSNSTLTTLSALTTASLFQQTYTSQSMPYTILTTDNVVLCTGASGTITLPTAVGVMGKIYNIIHGSTSLSSKFTIHTNSSQTIGGIADNAYILCTANERLVIISDGFNWQIIEHDTNTGQIADTTATQNYYTFVVSTGTYSGTIGATYTNNGHTYTLAQTFTTANANLIFQGPASPLASGTLTNSSGTHSGNPIYASVSGTPNNYGGTTTAPTAYGSPTTNAVFWSRNGKFANINYNFSQATAGVAGSGDYLFPLPTAMLADTTAITAFATGSAQNIYDLAGALLSAIPTTGAIGVTSNYSVGPTAYLYNTSSFRMNTFVEGAGGAAAGTPGSSFFAFSNALMQYNFTITIPISDWQP